MENSRKTLLSCFLLCALAFSLQVIPRWKGDSIIMDEEWNLTASYYYLKFGDVMTGGGTTLPGALCGLPLMFMDLKVNLHISQDWRPRSLSLLYMDNPGKLGEITLWCRSVDWVIGLLIGFLLFWAVRDGPLPLGLSALALWAFEPTLLAFSGTAKTDLSVAFWFFLCVLYFKKVQTQEKLLPFFWAGMLTALTASVRYNGMLILPVLLAMEIHYALTAGGGLKSLRKRLRPWLSGLAGFIVVINVVYLSGPFVSLKHYLPTTVFYLNMAAYFGQLREVGDQFVYFAGRAWKDGSYLCFPYHFFFKNTIPFLILLGAGTVLGLLKKGFFYPWVWVPPAVYLGLFWAFDKSMDIRHALPSYPFLILIAARAFQWLWSKSRNFPRAWPKALLLGLLMFHAGSVIRAFPYHIAYANELLDAQNKPSLLYSFNWNLGQDMKRLAETGLERGWKMVKLLTEQRTDPYFYGLNWMPWTVQDFVQPQPGMVYVYEPSLLYDHPVFLERITAISPWLGKTPPTGNVGGTMFYYEIPGVFDPAYKNDSKGVDSFPYYDKGIPPYRRNGPPDTWIGH